MRGRCYLTSQLWSAPRSSRHCSALASADLRYQRPFIFVALTMIMIINNDTDKETS